MFKKNKTANKNMIASPKCGLTKLVAFLTFIALMKLMACKPTEKDECEGVKEEHNSKKNTEARAAENVRTTLRDIQNTWFESVWNPSFSYELEQHLQRTGNDEPTIRDTAIVAEERSRAYLNQYSGNASFEADVAPQMRNNITADSTYIVTADDLKKFAIQNQACIEK